MISEQELENRIRSLKAIEPRKEWAKSNKLFIMESPAPRAGFFAVPKFSRAYVYSVLVIVILAGIIMSNPGVFGSKLSPIVTNDQSLKYLEEAEQKITKLSELSKTSDHAEISAAINESVATLKQAVNSLPEKADHKKVVAIAAKVNKINQTLSETRKQLGQEIALEEQKVLADKVAVYIEDDIAQTHKQLSDAVKNEIALYEKMELSESQKQSLEQIKSDFSEYIKTRDVQLLQSAVERLYFLSNNQNQ